MVIIPRNNWEPKEGLTQRQVEFGVRWWAEQALDDLFKDPALFVAAYEPDLLGKLREVVRAYAFAKLADPAGPAHTNISMR